MFILGVIPARGGSKGLPGKNILSLGGLPMIGWSIKAAKASETLNRTVVSTEDPEIARVARECGAEVPFMRPAELAQDDSSIVEVLRHAVSWVEKADRRPDIVVLLQPTSPLRSAADIDAVVRILLETGCDSAQTVALDRTHPMHRFKMEGDRLIPLFPEADSHSRRQDGPEIYKPTGAVYAARYALLMGQGRLRGTDHRGVVRPEPDSIDVDTALDFRLAEGLLSTKK